MVVSSYRLSCRTVLIIGGLKQLPRLRQRRNGAVSLWRSHPSFAKEGTRLARIVFRNFDRSSGRGRNESAGTGFANSAKVSRHDRPQKRQR